MSIEFLVTSLVIVATPGTGVLFTLAAGVARGTRASLIAVFACTLGVIPHMIAAMTGVAALLHTSALAFQTLKYLGVAYLLYMAWTTFRAEGGFAVDEDSSPRSTRSVIVSGVLLNVLNPKLTIFFFAFLPQFVSSGEPNALPRMLELSAVFMLLTLVVFCAYGIVAAAIRHRIVSSPRAATWISRFFAGSFVALSARLALTEK